MKIRNKLFLLITALLCAVIIAGCSISTKDEQSKKSKHFQRLRFRAKQHIEELHFDKIAHKWISLTKRRIPFVSSIPKGTGIFFKGAGRLALTPGITGEKGIFFNINARSFIKKDISISIRIERGKELIYHEQVQENKKGRISYPFSKILNFTKNDKIIIQAKGTGALIAGDAVIYDLIEKKKRKYVFIIALDTLRWDKVGRKVKGVALTPNLDHFKEDAAVFANAFAQSSWTLPSFTSFFTGLYEFNHRIFMHRVLDAAKPFLIENFSDEYMTAGINGGTWLMGKIGNSRGFDSYGAGSGAREEYAARTLFEKSVRFIEQNQAPALFMFMHTYAIHAPYIPPEEFLLKLNKKPQYRAAETFARQDQYKRNVPGKKKEVMAELYEAEIMAFDHFFGVFIDYLKKNNIYEQSLITFFSDHGEEFYEHEGWSHGHSLYNELIKVPLIIKFPHNVYKNATINENVGLIDVLPTLLDYCHIEQNRKIDGISLLPLLKKGKLARKTLISSGTSCSFFDQAPNRIALLFDHYKLIYNFSLSEKDKAFFREAGLPPEVPGIQVFDLKKDPLERNNLYPGCKDLIEKYRQSLSEIIKKVLFNLKQKRAGEVELSPEELEQLKALGYL
jgi:choline-sulfatase